VLRSALALGGGRVRLPAVIDHVEKSVSVARPFGTDLSLEEFHDGVVLTG
jgi:hypothetical protein